MDNLQTTIELDTFNIAFGEFIKVARLKRGLTQDDVSKLLGVSQSYYNRFEKGGRSIDFDKAIRICTILRIDIRKFLDDYIY